MDPVATKNSWQITDGLAPVYYRPGALRRLDEILGFLPRTRHAVVVTDHNVAGPWLAPAMESLERRFSLVHSIECPAGEESKSLELAWRLWEQLVEFGADRDSVLLALGGGVIGDLAGFVAATYQRGIRLVQLPTTVLAQVDSSLGGKTGINLPAGKNLVGAFWQPEAIVIDPLTLATLPPREYRSGLAEVVKYAVILDAGLFSRLEQDSMERASEGDGSADDGWWIRRCCELKNGIVARDERERSGLRACLNYGHTFGHAIETRYGYGTWLHGEAVAMGMMYAAETARLLGWNDATLLNRQGRLLRRLGLPVCLQPEPDAGQVRELLAIMQRDKKNREGITQLILPREPGRVELFPWPGDELVARAFSLEGLADV